MPKALPKLPHSEYPWIVGNDQIRLRWVVNGFTGEGMLFLDTMDEHGKMRVFKVQLQEMPEVECSKSGCGSGVE